MRFRRRPPPTSGRRASIDLHSRAMPRVTKVLRVGEARPARAIDTLMLDFDQRQTKQGFFFTGKGTCIEFDFAEPPALATDDALVLDDGSLIDVVADSEPLVEARISDAAALARLTWQLGDRHVPVQIFTNRLRVRRNAEVEALLAGIAAKITPLSAPFEPHGASIHASSHAHHHHGHEHHHAHDHDHQGHDHGHDHHHHDDGKS
jgi:urease accessory protein